MQRTTIESFLSQKNWAVVGFSADSSKYGHKVFFRLLEEGYTVYPINPNLTSFKDYTVYNNLSSLPVKPDVVITIVPPKITESIVKECIDLSVRKIWMQPGSENLSAIDYAVNQKAQVVFNECILKVLNNRT